VASSCQLGIGPAVEASAEGGTLVIIMIGMATSFIGGEESESFEHWELPKTESLQVFEEAFFGLLLVEKQMGYCNQWLFCSQWLW
jgi:hypothetical protein